MPDMPAFLALNQGALIVVYALTTWLFLVQFKRTRSAAVLVLFAGSLFTTIIVGVQLCAFPNTFAPGLLIGRGAGTLTWLWNLWHLAPPLFAIFYAWMARNGRTPVIARRGTGAALIATLLSVCAAGALASWLVLVHVDALPNMVDPAGGYWAVTTSGVGPALLALNVGAIIVLCAMTRLRTVLQLWLAVSLLLLAFDNIVTDLGAARATVGWFAGRMEALLAAIVVLAVYMHEVALLFASASDVAASRETARAEAERARESLEIALDASGMGDWQLDIATDTAHRTLRHDRLFGYAASQPSWGMARMMEHVLPDDREAAKAAFDRAVREGRLALECRIVRAGDGAVRWISATGRTHYDKIGRPRSMAGCTLDVTDRKAAEARLQQLERMEAIAQLTGGVAHDFNNLLTILLGALEMIVNRPAEAARVERMGVTALAAVRRGSDLTNKLLSFARRQIVQEQVVNANALLLEFKPLLQSAVGAATKVDMRFYRPLGPVRLDPSQLQATLLNLAANARDAMPEGGTLRLETRNVVLTEADILAMPDAGPGRYVCVSVEDNGAGMDPATVARAFEPFFTTKGIGQGVGLGLSQVYGFVRQAGGQCRLRSEPGKGCTVELYFPEARDTAGTLPRAPRERASGSMPLRQASKGDVVLLVEDEDALRELAAESLAGLGYKVLSAGDARAALDILRTPDRIDVLFSDVVMPGGMNGAQLAMEARRIRPDLKVLLTSGYTATAAVGVRELPEDVPLLRKPYRRDELAAKLQAVVG